MVQPSPRSSVSTRHPAVPQRQQPMLGLAGLAVGIVVTANLGLPVTGGSLAVDVLLVAIGFQLARGLRRSGTQRHWLQHFWLTTLARLMAPLLLSLGLMAAYWGWRGQLDSARVQELAGAGGFVLNIMTILGRADTMALEHLWLVAMIGQFILAFPLLVAASRRYLDPDRRAAALLGLAAVVAISRTWFLLAGTPASESIAINTLTRVDGLLVGAAIGLCPLATLRRRVPIHLAPGAFVGMLLLWIVAPNPSSMPIITLGVLTPVAIAFAGVIASAQAAGNPSRSLAEVLDNNVLRWLGERAFSIYIWHSLFGFTLSVDQLGASEGMEDWPGLAVFVIRLVFSLAAAAVSHRYLEVPAMEVMDELVDEPNDPPRSGRGGFGRPNRRAARIADDRPGRYAMPTTGAAFMPIPVVASRRTLTSRPPSVFQR